MSMINDALKRARESQGDAPPAAPPLYPVASPSDEGKGWILPTAIVLLLAAASLLIFSALFGHKSSKTVAPTATAMVTAQSRPLEPTSVPAGRAVPTAAPVPASNVAAGATPAAAGTSGTFEKLPRVQGIIFTPPHPVAIVDGKIVNVGDMLGRYQVKGITKFDVTFERPDGSLKQLGVGE